MLGSMLGTATVGPAFRAAVEQFGEGNPFLVQRLLEHWVEQGVLLHERGGWNTDIAPSADQLPSSVHEVLLAKVALLSAPARAIAHFAAVVGSEVGLELLQAGTSLSDDALFDALAELNAHAILLEAERGRFVFAQDLLRDLLYESLGAGVVAHHRQVADTLERLVAGQALASLPFERVIALAHQHGRALSPPEHALPCLLEAGTRSAKLFALADAERFLGAALDMLRAQPAESFGPERLGALTAMGDVKRVAGKAAEAETWLQEAVALADARGHRPIGRLLTSLAKALQVCQRFEPALEQCARSVAACRLELDPAGAARALLASSRINFFQGRNPLAVEQSEESLALALASGERSIMAAAYAWLGVLAASADASRLEEGIRHLDAARTIQMADGDQLGLNTTYNLLGNAQNMAGDADLARASFLESRRLCFEFGAHDEELFALVNLAVTDRELGDWSSSLDWARQAVAGATRLDSKFPLGIALGLEARRWPPKATRPRRVGCWSKA